MDIMKKANVWQRSASVASTSMFVRVQKNPIKISTDQTRLLTKIQSLDEFKHIKNTDFGFIVVSDSVANVLHQSDCDSLLDANFSEHEHHWFATLTLAEKSFNVKVCNSCKPE